MGALAGTPATGMPDSDQDLVDRARRGDQDAMRLLVERHQGKAIGLAWSLVGDRSDAEDIAQDAFLRAFRSLKGFRGDSRFRTWLFQIVVNTARTFRRTRANRKEEAIGGSQEFDQTAGGGEIESRVVARDAIRRAMATLPVELREAVVLRDVNGLDYKEIADLLDIPLGTVESRIFRGRARLREALTTAGNEETAR